MKGIVRAVSVVLIITIISKIMSLASNQYYLTFYQLDRYMDAFSYALALPNIVFNSIGTALTTIVIPIFAGYMAMNHKEKAFRFADNVMGVSVVITIALIGIGILLVPYLITITGFSDGSTNEFAIFAARMLLPVMLFYCLHYIFQGILQSLGKFNMPALISIPYSITVILYVFFLGDRYGVKGLVIATLIGLSFQAFILIPSLMKSEYQYKPRLNFKDPDIKKAAKLMLPILLGTSAYQINMLFNITISAHFAEGSVAIVMLVQTLILNMVLSFVYSVTSVMYPKFTEFASKQEWSSFSTTVLSSLQYVIFLLLPATVIFIALGRDMIDLIYGWGNFTKDNVNVAGLITALYAGGTIGHAVKEIVDRAFYSMQNTRLPAINGVIIMIVNILATLLFIPFWGIYAVPTAYTISLVLGAIIIVMMLHVKIKIIDTHSLRVFLVKGVVAAVSMFLIVFAMQWMISDIIFSSVLVSKIAKVLIPSILGGVWFIVIAKWMGMKEVQPIIDKGQSLCKILQRKGGNR
jgi:putative peptidoglycan lipid II flippase